MPQTGSDAGPSRIPTKRRASLGRRLSAVTVTVSSAVVAFLGCASVLDIDEDYVLESSQAASGGSGSGKATGGKMGAGGAGNGGARASGGSQMAAASGGTGDVPDSACVEGAECSADTKCCGGACVPEAPLVGCGAADCKPCPMPPAFGTMVCGAGGECAVKCNPNYELQAGLCVALQSNTGGVTGGGGSAATGGAAPAVCDAKACPGCGAPGPFGCCKNDNQCGCSWTPSGSGYCL